MDKPLPTASEIIRSVVPHPDLFMALVTEIHEGYCNIVLAPWNDDLDGMGTGAVGDGPFQRMTPYEDNQVIASVTRASGDWVWQVFHYTQPRGPFPDADAAMQECDRWLLDHGYYLVEPTCPIPDDCDIYRGG